MKATPWTPRETSTREGPKEKERVRKERAKERKEKDPKAAEAVAGGVKAVEDLREAADTQQTRRAKLRECARCFCKENARTEANAMRVLTLVLDLSDGRKIWLVAQLLGKRRLIPSA